VYVKPSTVTFNPDGLVSTVIATVFTLPVKFAVIVPGPLTVTLTGFDVLGIPPDHPLNVNPVLAVAVN
jgi:hypothetical protein